MRWRLLPVLVLALVACGTAGTGEGVAGIEPRDGRSGLVLSGVIRGRQVAVSDGAPRMRVDDCDRNTGRDLDVCFFSRDIDGNFLAVIIENPDALAGGKQLPVADPGCQPQVCDEVTDVAIVDVQLGADTPRMRATGGRLSLDVVQPRFRYAGTLRLQLPDGELSGTFDVVPKPEQ